MKKFTINCQFGAQSAPFDLYIGKPQQGNHPLQNQAKWLSENRGGTIPPEIMESFGNLLALAAEQDVSFEDLCMYAFEKGKEKELQATEAKQIETAQHEARDNESH